jgi:hypothetical protein
MQYKIANKCNLVTRNGVTKHDGRNVHAWVNFESYTSCDVDVTGMREISYNPMKSPDFFYVDNGDVCSSDVIDIIYFKNNKIYTI